MASPTNLCQHTDYDGTSCQSNDYILCPHCQLQLCLKHLNCHQELLRIDCDRFSEHINRVRLNLDCLQFDASHRQLRLVEQLDRWYQQRLDHLNRTYHDKQTQLNNAYVQAQNEFKNYRNEKEILFRDNLCRQWRKLSQQKQIHIDDLNNMKCKLDHIERGLDELQQLLIDVNIDQTTMNVNIVKRRYVEAAKVYISIRTLMIFSFALNQSCL
jgi:hypothetical protein